MIESQEAKNQRIQKLEMKTIMFFKVKILNIMERWWLMAQIQSKSQDIIGLRIRSFPTRRKNTKQGSCG
ncbi:MAG: hypothetical protein ACK518_01270 [bacterium]